ncbi:glycine zipper 2TM domain-containing protein [Pigmentiphaga litoralis]|uniref:glycine zipper 2TM domain-containing protein n=1 Tax=Pigmentiphaga litoralis TaxID=516702 RepID=UPI003B4285F9
MSPFKRIGAPFPVLKRERGAASLHPLIAAAAVCLIIMSGVAVAVMTGVLPSPMAKSGPESQLSAEAREREADTVASRFGKSSPATAAAPVRSAAPVERAPVARAPEPAPERVAAVNRCSDCGVVTSVRAVKVEGQGSGVGAVGGGVVGGLVGNQFGGGNGRTALTLLGAAGGALAGHEVEKHVRSTTSYQMTVRMDNGTTRTFRSASPYNWREGDPVRVINGRVSSRNVESGMQSVRVNDAG